MSQAKQCDRCGAFYPAFRHDLDKDYCGYYIVKNCHPPNEAYKLDLCDDCKKALFLWLGLGGENR